MFARKKRNKCTKYSLTRILYLLNKIHWLRNFFSFVHFFLFKISIHLKLLQQNIVKNNIFIKAAIVKICKKIEIEIEIEN